jgi:hypothetical protein
VKLGKIIRSIPVWSNTVIFANEGVFGERNIEQILEGLHKETGVRNLCVCVVKDVNDIRHLSEEQMNQLGWFRIAQIRQIQDQLRKGKQEQKTNEDENEDADDEENDRSV